MILVFTNQKIKIFNFNFLKNFVKSGQIAV